MKCKDCGSFKPEKNIEAACEISPSGAVKGKCEINNKSCTSDDTCGCNTFNKK